MVALSLYRGNMHRVPDATRRWLMPDQNIPFKSFKALQRRRLKALSSLKSETAATSFSNPNPNSSERGEIEAEERVEVKELRDEEEAVVVVKEEGEVEETCKDGESVGLDDDAEKNDKVPKSSDNNEKRRKEAEEISPTPTFIITASLKITS